MTWRNKLINTTGIALIVGMLSIIVYSKFFREIPYTELTPQQKITYRIDKIEQMEKSLKSAKRLEAATAHPDEAMNIVYKSLELVDIVENEEEKARYFNNALRGVRNVREGHLRYGEAQNALGLIYTKQGKWREAVSPFKRATEKNPNEPEYWDNLAKTYLKLDQREKFVEASKVLFQFQGN
ncbi:MAG: tetratricopeptide repeat protein [Candidatus Woesearchaeota archaeon]|jgi:tetratricopeptide (TPR) repeat protein|nr:tetratricopeptide repeat protein [Candidatus Woesearchaeota archaeon]MDP7324252.1 tetratricopeptide repeat protein [Candidatus Woesearchaeota archaeon]MDP7458404.1 tetratricopeptide repeat protein [Candidatus Woesearchaeota archaeon]